MGINAALKCVANPATSLVEFIDFPNVLSPLYGGRKPSLPADRPHHQSEIMSAKKAALGHRETQGFTAIPWF